MTTTLPKTSRSGFSIIDLLFAMILTSIILIGAYRIFLSNLRHTSQTLDIARLDNKTKNIIEKLYSDVSKSNGNIISGTPTIFPLIGNERDPFKGFMLVQADEKLPVLEMRDSTFRPPSEGGTAQVTLVSSSMGEFDFTPLKPGRFAILYNFGNYSWIPLVIRRTNTSSSSGDQITVELESFLSNESWHWSKFLSTPKCKDYMYKKQESMEHTVCTVSSDLGENGEYQKLNTVFIIADIVTYELRGDRLFRNLNENEDNSAMIANGVEEFIPVFNMNENQIYPGPRFLSHSGGGDDILTKGEDFKEFIGNLVPKNSPVATDDCQGQINYICLDKTNSLTKLAYGYVSQNIKGIDIALSIQRKPEDKETEGEEDLRRLRFYLALDQNHGFTSLSAFPPTRVVASRMESTNDRNYGSIMSQGFFVRDPMGGTLSAPPYYTALAPMISAVEDVKDTANDEKTQNICSTCPRDARGNCPQNYPWVCNIKRTVGETTYDYTTCQGDSSALARANALCLNPQGSLNDRGLDPDNQINPMIIALGPNSSVQNRFSLKQDCDTEQCPLQNGYYNLYPGLFTDTPFPLTLEPHFDSNGELDKLYIGSARLRIPVDDQFQNYYRFFASTVFALDLRQDPLSTTLIRTNPSPSQNPADEITLRDDLASVSDLQILTRNIGNSTYEEMLMSSTEASWLISRMKGINAPDTSWSMPSLVFKDESLQPVKYSLKLEGGGFLGIVDVANYPDQETSGKVTWENPKIASFYAPNPDMVIYATYPLMPDLPINDSLPGTTNNQWFFNNAVRYQIPITRPDTGEFFVCDPNPLTRTSDPANSDLNDGCFIGAGKPKPIWWGWCGDRTPTPEAQQRRAECFIGPDGNRPPQFPVASGGIIPNYSASLKVAYRQPDGKWDITEVAKIHGTVSGITENPITKDLLISSRNNILSVSYEELQQKLADMKDPNIPEGSTNKKPLKLDLAYFWNDKHMYAANNIINSVVDPESPYKPDPETSKNVQLLRLSGLNIFPSNKLEIFFADSLERAFGYIYQAIDNNIKRLFAQIVYREVTYGSNHDANLDAVAVHQKGLVDLKEKTAKWLLQPNPSRVWAETAVLDENGKALYGVPEPIPVPPPMNIWNCNSSITTNRTGCSYDRNILRSNMNCIFDPTDQRVAGNILGVRCGQDPNFRACDGDVLASVGIGSPGRQMGFMGCGMGLAPHEDPTILPPSPDTDVREIIIPEPGFGEE